jgi:hypothetical protein
VDLIVVAAFLRFRVFLKWIPIGAAESLRVQVRPPNRLGRDHIISGGLARLFLQLPEDTNHDLNLCLMNSRSGWH